MNINSRQTIQLDFFSAFNYLSSLLFIHSAILSSAYLTIQHCFILPLLERDKKNLQALHTQQSQQRSFKICLASQWLAKNQSGNRSQHCWHKAISFYLDIFTLCLNFAFCLEGLHHVPVFTHSQGNPGEKVSCDSAPGVLWTLAFL